MSCVIPLLFSALVEFVNPFIGTAGQGHCYPGAAYPFGLVQASPDSGERGCDRHSGYVYEDKVINMFSQSHNPGGGCPDYADIGLMPYVGECDDPTSPFDKSTERAEPGYYAVTLSRWKARVEMTATEHCGFYRIVFGGDAEEVNLLCDPDHGMSSVGEWAKKRIELVDLDKTGVAELKGKIIRSGFVPKRPIGFTYRFSLPSVAFREIPAKVETGVPHAPSFVYTFRLDKTRELLVKVGLSTRSMEGAARNVDAELPDWNFDRIRRICAEKWERILERVELDAGTPLDQKVQFYTAVYRMMAQPTNIADAGETPYYSEFAFWDTFRATHPFYTMFAAEYVPAFINSMIEHRRRFGYLPVLTKWGRETHCMIATHGVAVMVDAYLKGFSGVDWEAAWEAIEETLRRKHPDRKKEGWDILDKYGYYPCDLLVGEGVSRTLECSYDDWCAYRMAERLGKSESAAFFRKRSENWRNVLDPSTGHMRGRKTDGSWRDPFDPYLCGHENDWPADFTEGSAMQYRWHVLQDPAALIEALGGKAKACVLLDELFADNHVSNQDQVKQDVCGLWGQYVHGNEPSHHIAYLYQYADRPDRTAERIRGILDRFCRNAPDGLCGNEDHGQMSAWYVFACLGFYPVNPASGEFVLGAPQIPGVSLRLSNGKTFRMVAKNFSRENLYVKSALLNGRPISGFILRYDDIMKGGELVFEMSASEGASRIRGG